MNLSREEALIIAKNAYYDIQKVINSYENDSRYQIIFCWDDCLWVGEHFFCGSELRGED